VASIRFPVSLKPANLSINSRTAGAVSATASLKYAPRFLSVPAERIQRVPLDKGSAQQPSGQFPEPIIRQFKSDLTLIQRDGQTVESTFATDPLTGKLFKVSVTLNLLK
jgi:hypothetical protein